MIRKVIDEYRINGLKSVINKGMNHIPDPIIVGKSICLYLQSIYPGYITYQGVKVYIKSPVVRQNLSRFARTKYEHQEAQLIKKYLPEDHPVVELGGGLGFISVLTDKYIDSDHRVTVFEANKNLIPIIKSTANINNSNLSVVHAAYAPDSNQVDLMLSNDFVSSSTEINPTQNTGTQSVPTISIKDLSNDLQYEKNSLICDIEGAEFKMLDNDEIEYISDYFSTVIIEIHGSENDQKKIINAFLDMGYHKEDRCSNVYVFKRK